MPSFQGSPPFSLSGSDWLKLGKSLMLAIVGAVAGFVGATLTPELKEHISNDWGVIIVTLITSLTPVLLNLAIKYFGDTTRPTFKVFLLATAVLVMGSSALAADGVLVVAKSGYYVLETDPSTGIPSLSPVTTHFKQVVVLGDPDPTPEPPTPNLTARAVAIRDAASKATADAKRVETAMKLATLYSEIATKIGKGEIKGADAIAFVAKTGADMLIGGNTAAWQPFRDTLNAQFTAAAQEGGKDADYAKLLTEVSSGLAASVPRAEQYGALDLRQILELVRLIIDMILKLPLPTPQPAGGPLRP